MLGRQGRGGKRDRVQDPAAAAPENVAAVEESGCGTIHQEEDTSFINTYAPSLEAPKYVKQF